MQKSNKKCKYHFLLVPKPFYIKWVPDVFLLAARKFPPLMPLPNVVGVEIVKFGDGDVHEPAQPTAKDTCKLAREAKFK